MGPDEDERRGRLTVVGVGPGDPDLLTVKAVNAIRTADVVAYPVTATGEMAADSAAPYLSQQRRLPFTLPMTGDGAADAAYDAAAEAIAACLSNGEAVALLCEGDPMLYGSAASIMDRLARDTADVSVIPGITAASAAAAAVGRPLARGADPVTIMPATAGERALRQVFARPGGVVVYKVGRHAEAVRRAAIATGRDGDVVTRATCPDERCTPLGRVHGPLPYFSCVVASGGTAMAQQPWDGARVAVVTLGPSGAATAAAATHALREAGFIASHHAREGGDVTIAHTATHLAALYREGVAIVAVMASGIVVRALADVLDAKGDEPPVVSVADDGSAVVPLLGAHRGAARLGTVLGAALGVQPAITTRGDVRFGLALDAPPEGFAVADPAPFKRVASALAAGEGVAADAGLTFLSSLPAGPHRVAASIHPPRDDTPTYIAARVALGMGASRGADPAAAIAATDAFLREAGVDPRAVAVVTSLDVKADEAAIEAVAAHLGVPFRVYAPDVLAAEEPRLLRPSEVVREAVGVAGVAEAAALAAAGPSGTLLRPKVVADDVTLALALSEAPIARTVGRARGTVSVVGIGPGTAEWRTPEASHALATADAYVGYTLYLDMVERWRAPHQIRHDFPLGAEAERVRFALEEAGTGRHVALISSGDPGIYAMGALAAEMLDTGDLSPAASRVALHVLPGVSAAQAAAARVGAPLGHDFCFISLSDLLTPWPVIERRLEAAAAGDFAVALYNPRSQRRTVQLGRAFAILSGARPSETPVIIAANLGRTGERVRHTTLGEADPETVDMLSVVLVGASQTRRFTRGDGRSIVYTPRGYHV